MGSLVSTQKGSMALSLTSIELAFRDLVGPEFAKAVTTCVASMDWADDEIAQAQRRHPDITDVLYHSFSLLRATHDRMSTEFIYRPHARELTERVAAGTSTKPGTSVEVAFVADAGQPRNTVEHHRVRPIPADVALRGLTYSGRPDPGPR